jgi:phage structural protein
MTIQYFSGNWHSYLEFNVTTSSQDRVANLSVAKVTVAIGFEQNWPIEFSNTYGAYVGLQMAGQTHYLRFGELFLDGSKKTLGTVEFTVPHDEDGSATRKLQVWTGSTDGITYNNWYLGSVDTSQDITFAKIPRMSKVASVSGTRELGQELTITLDRKVESFTHQVWYKVWGSDWYDLGTGLGTTVKFTPSPENARKNVNVASSTFDICVRTFDGDKQIGIDEYSVGWYIGLPSGTQPTLETIELVDKAKATKDIVGKNTFVQTFSEMVGTFKGMEGTYGSTIKTFHAEVVGQKMAITSNGGTFQFFKNYGDYNVEAYVIDSRGLKSNVVTVPIKVLQYFAPILSFEAVRGGGDQQTIVVRRTARIAPLMVDGVQKNPMRLKFKVKPANDGYFTDNKGGGIDSTVINSLTNSNSDLFGTFSADKAWIVEGTISDAYASFTFTAPIVGPEEVVQCRTPKGTGFGKIWERGSIDAKGDIYSHNEIVQVGRLTQVNGKSLKMTGSANDLMKTGLFYSYGMSDLPSNLTGSQLYGYIQVNTHPSDENYVMQTYTPYDANVIYMRRKTNYGWQPWVRFTPSDVPISGQWSNATYLNGWRNYSNDYHPVQYKVNSDGSIELRGSCKGGNATQWKEVLKINLPTKLEKTTFIRGMTKDYNLCTLTVYEDGRIVVVKDVNNDWLCLDGITITN